MLKLCLLTSKKWYKQAQSTQLQKKYFINEGFLCSEVCWEDIHDWSVYDVVIISSTWGFEDNYKQYLTVLQQISLSTLLLPFYDIVKDNIDKEKQLATLTSLMLPTVPTLKVTSKNIESVEIEKVINYFNTKEFVLKPNISASGHGVYLFSESRTGCNIISTDKELKEALYTYFQQDKIALIQPYIKEISQGEFSLIFIGGIFSHAILRYPGVLNDHKPSRYIEHVPQSLLLIGHDVIKKYHPNSIIHRIDFAISNNHPIIMEIECNEPDLFLFRLPKDKQNYALFLLKEAIFKEI